ncbi:MAG: aminotransferase class V-fold PLP-dependent enzyme [Deltaproteobacteria bacterium]|nr:aminotransferase class V-fold PLP-dependent enzyme [Candidatus Zymogenaceae bacterium]
MVYLDNAATSFPKPQTVPEAIVSFMTRVGANPGRSGHYLSVEAERIRYGTREAIGRLFNHADPQRVVFTANVTAALNLVLFGMVQPGDRVVVTGMEHNSVMRPLRFLEGRGVTVTLVETASDGTVDPQDVASTLDTPARLVCTLHASNVIGTVVPIGEISRICRDRGVPYLVDAAQTAGCVPIDLGKDPIDMLAFTGHKGLLGPTGTGGLVLSPSFDEKLIGPLVYGGTGSRSEQEYQPEFLPDRFESGTCNIAGIAGLSAGLDYILTRGLSEIRAHESGLVHQLIAGLEAMEGVTVYGTSDPKKRTAAVSFRIAGIDNGITARRLSEEFDIMCRPGLHCAPRAHKTIGTFPGGTVRLSIGPFNTEADIDAALSAVAAIAGK